MLSIINEIDSFFGGSLSRSENENINIEANCVRKREIFNRWTNHGYGFEICDFRTNFYIYKYTKRKHRSVGVTFLAILSSFTSLDFHPFPSLCNISGMRNTRRGLEWTSLCPSTIPHIQINFIIINSVQYILWITKKICLIFLYISKNIFKKLEPIESYSKYSGGISQ